MPSNARSEIANQHLLVLRQESTAEPVTARLAQEGSRMFHVYGRRVMIGSLPAGTPENIRAMAPDAQVAEEAVGEAPEALSEAERLGVQAWNLRQSEEFSRAKTDRRNEGISWDRYEPPDHSSTMHGRAASGTPGASLSPGPDTSAFLIGSVGVGIVIVEGPDEDLQFSQVERTRLVAEVQEGLTWLAQQEPRAQVTWFYDIRTVRVNVPRDPTLQGFDPKEELWRNPALEALGFSPDLQGVADLAETIRDSLGTRWAYVSFFTKYDLQHFAYALKPRVVMSYFNGAWGVDDIDRVFAHETCHVFGCPDEYAASNCDCNSRFGFLNERNGNCILCSPDFSQCLMESNIWALCDFSRTHLGWRDSDGDGRLDPLQA